MHTNPEKKVYTVGLTGGIGSGKSTVAALFANLGVPIIDADLVAHQISNQPEPGLKTALLDTFGHEIFAPDLATLDRAVLAQLVYQDPSKRCWLEQCLHPLIQQEMQHQLALVNYPYTILMVPLLIEAGWTTMVDRVLVIDCDTATQWQRVQARDQMTKTRFEAILQAQTTRTERLQHADDCISNPLDTPHSDLADQVKAHHRHYLAYSKRSTV